jgi:hypothetical protein
VDIDQAIDEVGTMLGVPQRVIVSDDKVAEKRGARAQQQQMAQQVQMGMAGVQAAEQLGKTPLGDTTALNQLIGV